MRKCERDTLNSNHSVYRNALQRFNPGSAHASRQVHALSIRTRIDRDFGNILTINVPPSCHAHICHDLSTTIPK